MQNLISNSITHRVISSLAISSLIWASLIPFQGSAEAVSPGYNGKIAFYSNRDGNDELYLINPDGTGETRLTTNTSREFMPAWSPDGSKLAYISDQTGVRQIFVANPDGSNPVNLTNSLSHSTQPVWAPDGSKIAFTRSSGSPANNDIWVMNADGSNQIQLTTDPGSDTQADWSPDGQLMAFTSPRDGASRIYTMKPDGSEQTPLGPSQGTVPKWSPNGSQLLFQSNQAGNFDVYVMNADGTNIQQLTSDPANDYIGVWSPDGTRIAFISERDGGATPAGRELYVMDADGTNVQRLTNNGAMDWEPAWQPTPNTSPTTTNDTLTTPYNTASTADILANDTDEEALDGQYLTISSQPLNGTALIADGKVKYTSDDGFKGADELTYQICDSFLLDQQCATGVLSITVQAPGAPALTVTKVGDVTYENGTASYTISNKRPTFVGTASPGSTIKVEIHSDPILLTTTADSSGNWSVTPSSDLPAGEHTVSITATLNGVTTELDSFVLGITSAAEIPNTGASTLPLRFGGLALLAAGVGSTINRRRLTRCSVTVPRLFPTN